MRFSDIIGYETTKNHLINSVKNNTIAHAQLFLGKEGYGHLALALAYASYINCTQKLENDACGECNTCIKMKKYIHPDLHFIFPVSTTKKVTKVANAISDTFLTEWRCFLEDQPFGSLSSWANTYGAENKQSSISKEEARQIVRKLSLKSFDAEYKIMLIWLPELMNTTSANAILKILEEPPEKTVFLLVVNEADNILSTITSRTQLVNIPPYSQEDIQTYLTKKLMVDKAKANYVSNIAEGNLDLAIKLTHDVKDESEVMFQEWMRHCYRQTYSEIVDMSENFNKLSKNAQQSFLTYGLKVFREAMVFLFTDEELLTNKKDTFTKNFSKVLNDENLPLMITSFDEALGFLQRNASPKMTFMALSIKFSSYLKIK